MVAHRIIAVLVSALMVPMPLLAADCSLATAQYRSAEDGFTLSFVPLREALANQTNSFTLERSGDERVLEGSVIWNQGISRPNGALRYDCPEDAFTEDDFADCTYWQGVVYQIDAGEIDYIGAQTDAAPQTLLLPDFGRVMRYSGFYGDVFDSGDVFTLESCAP